MCFFVCRCADFPYFRPETVGFESPSLRQFGFSEFSPLPRGHFQIPSVFRPGLAWEPGALVCKFRLLTLSDDFRISKTDIVRRKGVKAAKREILLSFWKVHILHHAGEAPLHGQWVIHELRRHGYDISAGTLYPLLKRMERVGWLRCAVSGGGPRARRNYRLTAEGKKVLAMIREQIKELYEEVVVEPAKRKSS